MERSECHYLFNKLYIDPLIGWIQRCEESEAIEFGKASLMITKHDSHSDAIGKDCLGLGLVELEHAYLESDDASETSSGEAGDSDHDDDGDNDE